jgi:hypothetical protein
MKKGAKIFFNFKRLMAFLKRCPRYTIVLNYSRPEFGPHITFLSTRCIWAENKDINEIKEAFVKAFKKVHPTWLLRKIKVQRWT